MLHCNRNGIYPLQSSRKRSLQFNRHIKEVLPYETKQQRELFDYLNYAYIGGRYRSEEEFPDTQKQLDYWGKEAEKLLKLTEKIYQERIDCLKEIER